MSRELSVDEALRVRGCLTPGCLGEAHIGEFCDQCRREKSARMRRSISVRAVMERERQRMDDREAQRRTDEVARRRARTQRIVDGRHRAVATLERLQAQADRRGDRVLVETLGSAIGATRAVLLDKGAAA